jgi:hypothetical protein
MYHLRCNHCPSLEFLLGESRGEISVSYDPSEAHEIREGRKLNSALRNFTSSLSWGIHLEYGSFLFQSAGQEQLAKLDRFHYRAALITSGCTHGSNTSNVLNCLGWMTLSDRRKEKLITLMYDNEINAVPSYISDLFN